MKLGYSTWGMPTIPIDQALASLSNLGYDRIELTVIPGYTTELSMLHRDERGRIKRLFKEHNLDLPAIAAHSSLLSDDPATHDTNMTRLKQAVDLASELAVGDTMPVVNTTPGSRDEKWDAVVDILVQRVWELVEYAQPRGVTIAMEPHVGAVINTPEKMLQLLKLVDSPYLGVNFDISHFDIIGLTIEETVPKLAPYTAHTHVKDQRGHVPNFDFLIPGEGDFDYVSYLRAMHNHGYNGYITIEISKMVQRRPDYDPYAAAEASYRTLSDAFGKAQLTRI